MARYWINGTGTWDASDTTHWSATSGGSSGASVPSGSDDVVFDSNSGLIGATVTLGYAPTILSFTLGDGSMASGTSTFNANGYGPSANYFSFIANSGFTFNLSLGSGTWIAKAWLIGENSGTINITQGTSTIKIAITVQSENVFLGGGKTYNNVWIDGDGFASAITGSNTFSDLKITTGTYIYFLPNTTQTVSTLTATGTAGHLITLTTDSEIGPISTGSVTDGGTGYSVSDVLTVYGGNSDATVTVTGVSSGVITSVTLTTPGTGYSAGSSYTLIGAGDENAVYEVSTLSSVSQFTISKSSGTVSCDYLDLRNSNATGGATWYAGANSVDTTNNDGWIFTTPSSGRLKYWNGTSWTLKPLKYWNGSSWVEKTLKYWDGDSWES